MRFVVLGNKLFTSFLASIVSLALVIPTSAAPAQAEPSFTQRCRKKSKLSRQPSRRANQQANRPANHRDRRRAPAPALNAE
jgi:hypothetical protein